MARELIDTSPIFAAKIRECAEVVDPLIGGSLEDVLREVPGCLSIERDDVVQPALFSVMVALAGVVEGRGRGAGRGDRQLAGRDRRRLRRRRPVVA